jgi:hypothetical protein
MTSHVNNSHGRPQQDLRDEGFVVLNKVTGLQTPVRDLTDLELKMLMPQFAKQIVDAQAHLAKLLAIQGAMAFEAERRRKPAMVDG